MIAVADASEGTSRIAIGIRSPLRTDLAEYVDHRGPREVCRHIPIADALESLAAELDAAPSLKVRSVALEWDDYSFSSGMDGFSLERLGELLAQDRHLAAACRAAVAAIRSIPATPRLAMAG